MLHKGHGTCQSRQNKNEDKQKKLHTYSVNELRVNYMTGFTKIYEKRLPQFDSQHKVRTARAGKYIFIYILLFPGQTGEASESSKKQGSFGNRAASDRGVQ